MRVASMRLLAAFACVTANGAFQPVLADVDGGVAPPESQPSGESAEARRLFEGGVSAFDAGDYDVAIVRFRAAYARTRAPALLFNIAQALRRKGDCAGGLQAYESFKSLSPDRARALDVDNLIKEMKAVCATETKPDPEAPRAVRPVVVAKTDLTIKDSQRPPTVSNVDQPLPGATSVQRPLAWTAVGLGLGLVAFGGYNAYAAAQTDQRLSDLSNAGTPWNAYATELESQGSRQRTLSAVGLASGGVVLAIGASLLLWDWWRGNHPRSQ